jgi:hypothetical protein
VKNLLHSHSVIFIDCIAWSRFLNYHGEPGARLNSDQSVHRHDTSRLSWPMSIFSLCLFHAPLTHLTDLRSVYTDGLVKAITWKKHLNSLTSSWQEYVLYVRSPPLIIFSDVLPFLLVYCLAQCQYRLSRDPWDHAR